MRFAVRDPGFKARISYLGTRIPNPELQVALFPPVSPISLESGIAFRDPTLLQFASISCYQLSHNSLQT